MYVPFPSPPPWPPLSLPLFHDPDDLFLATSTFSCRGLQNSEQVIALPEDTEDLAFGNDVYSIQFASRESFPTYGCRYEFYLQDAVEDVPEYLVDWENFERSVSAPSGQRVDLKLKLTLYLSLKLRSPTTTQPGSVLFALPALQARVPRPVRGRKGQARVCRPAQADARRRRARRERDEPGPVGGCQSVLSSSTPIPLPPFSHLFRVLAGREADLPLLLPFAEPRLTRFQTCT